MKSSTIAAVLAPAVASAQWYNGAPECAQSCLSSAFDAFTATATGSQDWPLQSDYCQADRATSVNNCLNQGCAATPTAISSYASMSSSLCSQYASCTAAGSTGVHTVTYSAGPVNWAAPGGWGSAGAGVQAFNGNGNGDSAMWNEWADAAGSSRTWTGGVMTYTGCVGNGSPWFVGPGCGYNALGGFNGWVGWGSGWTAGPTSTGTITYTSTNVQGSGSTITAFATVAAAVSGTITTTSIVGTPTGNAAAPGAEGSVVTGMMGVALGAVVAVAGML